MSKTWHAIFIQRLVELILTKITVQAHVLEQDHPIISRRLDVSIGCSDRVRFASRLEGRVHPVS